MEGRMYRTMSGHSLAEPELVSQHMGRRNSEQVGLGGKRNFRSKRFSRNLEREPALKRAQSFHMDQRMDGDSWLDQQRRTFYRATSKNSVASEHFGPSGGGITDSSDVEDAGHPSHTAHFTSTVTSSTRGPGGIGSYLSRREFGSNDGQPDRTDRVDRAAPESGYVSHSSGGGYPKLQMQNKNTIKSFTMSMDRGFHGGPPGPPSHMGVAAPPPASHFKGTVPSAISGSISDFARFRSMEDLGPVGLGAPVKDKANSSVHLVKLLREAEQSGFTSEDIQVAVNHCGDGNPVQWLLENWENMIETVMTLASNVGHEAEENTVGTISNTEARDALREHKGNIWVAVTACVQARQKKYEELMGKGNFSREDTVTMLTAHNGNVEAAFQELNKAQLKPFLLRIWGQGEQQIEGAHQPNQEKDQLIDASPGRPSGEVEAFE